MLEEYHSQIEDIILSHISDFETKLIKFWMTDDDDIHFTKSELRSIYGSSLTIYLNFLPELRQEGLIDHIYLAAKYNNIGIAEYIYQKHDKWYKADEKSYVVAGENGNLAFLHWLVKNQCPFSDSSSAIVKTLLAGQVKCLDYLISQHGVVLDKFKINNYVGSSTLECAKLLVDKYHIKYDPSAIKMAIESRNYPLFKYLFELIKSNDKDINIQQLMNTSVEYGCSYALEYLYQSHGCLMIHPHKIKRIAEKYQYFDILNFLSKHKNLNY